MALKTPIDLNFMERRKKSVVYKWRIQIKVKKRGSAAGVMSREHLDAFHYLKSVFIVVADICHRPLLI